MNIYRPSVNKRLFPNATSKYLLWAKAVIFLYIILTMSAEMDGEIFVDEFISSSIFLLFISAVSLQSESICGTIGCPKLSEKSGPQSDNYTKLNSSVTHVRKHAQTHTVTTNMRVADINKLHLKQRMCGWRASSQKCNYCTDKEFWASLCFYACSVYFTQLTLVLPTIIKEHNKYWV